MDGAEQDEDGEQRISNTHIIHTRKEQIIVEIEAEQQQRKSSQLLLWLTEEHTEHASLGVTDGGGKRRVHSKQHSQSAFQTVCFWLVEGFEPVRSRDKRT